MELHGRKVLVISVTSVENFYVIRKEDLDRLEKIQQDINSPKFLDRLKEERRLEEELPVFRVGEKVLARFKGDGQFYRAELLAQDEQSSEVKVLFSDFGNIEENIDIAGLYPLPYNLQMIQSFAIRCCLSCSSSSEKGKTTKEFIESLDSSHPLLLQVFSVRRDCLEVDLVKITDGGEHLSIRDYLVFLGLAFFAPPWDKTKIPNIFDQTLETSKLDMKVGDIHKGIVSYIPFIHPGGWLEFSVIVTSAVPAYRLPRLMKKMLRKYDFPRSELLWGVESLVFPGMICAAKDDEDGDWYRCEVISNVKGRIFKVRYVDFGDVKPLVVYRLRRLFPEFIDNYPVMAKTVLVPVKIETTAQAHQVNRFLKKNLLGKEVGFEIIKVLKDKVVVDIDLEGEDIKEIVNLLKSKC